MLDRATMEEDEMEEGHGRDGRFIGDEVAPFVTLDEGSGTRAMDVAEERREEEVPVHGRDLREETEIEQQPLANVSSETSPIDTPTRQIAP